MVRDTKELGGKLVKMNMNRLIALEVTLITTMIAKDEQPRETETNTEIEGDPGMMNIEEETVIEIAEGRMTTTEEEIHQTQEIPVHPITGAEIEGQRKTKIGEGHIMELQATGQDQEAIDEMFVCYLN